MLKNILANFIGKFWSLLSVFFFIPIYINILGFENYSIISFTLIIAGLVAVLDSGLTATLSREFARSDKNLKEKNKTFKTLESIYFITVSVIIVLLILLANFIANKFINIEHILPENLEYYIKILAFDIGFQMLFRFYLGGVYGFEKQVLANKIQVSWGVLRNGLVILVIYLHPSLEYFFLWQALINITFAALTKMYVESLLGRKEKLDLHIRIDQNVLKRVWKFASGMMLISLVAALNTQLDKLAITKLLPIEELGYYTLCVSLATGLLVIVSPISSAALPRLTTYFTDINRLIEAQRLFDVIFSFSVYIIFSLMINIQLYSYEAIWIWTGSNEIATKTNYILPVIVLSYAMISLTIIPFNVAIANSYTKVNNIGGIISLLITLPSYFYVTSRYGVFGAAIVFAVVQTLYSVIYIYIIYRKFIGAEFTRYLVEKIIFPIVLIISIAFLLSLIPIWSIQSRISIMLWIMIKTFLTFFFSIILLFRKKNIVFFWQILTSKEKL